MSRLWKPQNHTEAQHLSVADRGLAQSGGARRSSARQRPGSGRVHVLGGLPGWCGSSHNLAVLQTSLPWRSAVPSVKQNREGTNASSATPVRTTERGARPRQHTYGQRDTEHVFLLVLRPLFHIHYTQSHFNVQKRDEL